MNPAGPIRRYSCTSGQPFVHFSRSVNAWIGVPDGGQGSQPLPLGGRQPDTDMSAPCVAHPVDRVGQPQPVQSLLATAIHSANVKSRRTASLLPCDGPSIAYTVRCRPRFPISGSQDRESTNRLCHNTTGVRRRVANAAARGPCCGVRGRGDHGNASNYFGFRNFGSRRILGCHGDVKAAAAGPPGYRPGARPAARVPRRPRRAAS